jgi:hypothetical protein
MKITVINSEERAESLDVATGRREKEPRWDSNFREITSEEMDEQIAALASHHDEEPSWDRNAPVPEPEREPLSPDSDEFRRLSRHVTTHARPGALVRKPELAPGYLFAGEISCYFGAPGQTKSVLAIDHACRLATGISWDGENDADRPRYNILYIAAERSRQVRQRIDAFAIEHGTGDIDNLAIYDGPINLCTEDDSSLFAIIDASTAVVGRGPFDLIVIDTLAAAMMGKPTSDTHATGAAAHNLTQMSKYQGAHVMVVHHQPVSGEPRLSGGHLAAVMDVIVHVEKTKAGSLARVMKDNGRAESSWVTFAYTLKSIAMDYGDGHFADEPIVLPGEPPTSITQAADVKAIGPKARKLTAGQAEVLAALDRAIDAAGAPVGQVAWRTEYNAKAPATESAATRKVRFHRAKKSLTLGGEISGSDEDDHWSIPSVT